MRLSDGADHGRYEVRRDGVFEMLGMVVNTPENALVFCEDERSVNSCVDNTAVACVITSAKLADALPDTIGLAVADSPRRAFYELHNHLAERTDFYWKDFETDISPEAQIHPAAYVASRNVRIGAGTVIEPRASILEHCVLGNEVVIRTGTTVGSEGFEFKRVGDRVLPVRHAGGVRLGDRVEIQSNTAVDRAIFGGFTELGNDTKVDNLVHIAHGVKVGRRCFIVANAMLGGSTIIGDDVWIGPGSAISNQIRIGDGATVTIGAVVTRDVPAGERVTGNFAVPHERFLSFLRTMR